MTGGRPRRRALRGFRGRLALSIALSFILLGAVLVGVQLVILSQSIADTINVSVGTEGGSGAVPGDSSIVTDSSDCVMTPETTDCEVSIPEEAGSYSQAVATDVMQTYVTWSVILLLAFAAAAAVLAWFLTRSPARKISGITALAEDISEHDLSRRIDMGGPRDEITELGDRIDTMLSRLEAAFASQDQFVANASHELRTPITAVRTALEAPLTQGRVPDDLEPYLRRALRSTQRMDELITALLLIARSRHLDPQERSVVDLGDLLRRELEETAAAARSRRLSIAQDLPDRPVTVEGNAEALGIAVRNLLRNAVQHNRDDGRIRVVLEDDAGNPSLTIDNSGLVYTEAELAELTRAFNRGHQTRLAGTPGTGLGLTIIESIAAAHDATLTLRPGDPDGIVVTLAFGNAGSTRD